MIYGVRCGFYSGDPLKMISEDLPCLKPTLFTSVPRLYNRIYDKIKEAFDQTTGLTGALVNRAVRSKLA